MTVQLSDLDELAQKIRNSAVRNYFNEAIISYRAGAYRAAVISTWISICIDVIEKIKELSVENDAKAKLLEAKLNGIQANDYRGMQDFEKNILSYACDDLELISPIEKSHLERIKDDRNICAHPTFSTDSKQFIPSPELTRAYIVQSATCLLTKSPLRGKVIINETFSLINEESFPSDEEKAFIILSSAKNLGRAKESSIKNLIIIILKRIFKDEDTLSFEVLPKLSAALGAISRLFPAAYNETIKDKIVDMLSNANDKLFKRIIPILNSRPEIWSVLDKAITVRIEQCIAIMNLPSLWYYHVPSLASKNSFINLIFQKKISNEDRSNIEPLLTISPESSLKDLAIEFFIESKSFASAYSSGISILIPHAKFISDKDLDVLFFGMHENKQWNINQILNAGGIDEVLSQLYLKTKGTVINHSQMWLKFVNDCMQKDLTYDSLNQLLVDDHLMTPTIENDAEK